MTDATSDGDPVRPLPAASPVVDSPTQDATTFAATSTNNERRSPSAPASQESRMSIRSMRRRLRDVQASLQRQYIGNNPEPAQERIAENSAALPDANAAAPASQSNALFDMHLQALNLQGYDADADLLRAIMDHLKLAPSGALLYSLRPSETGTDVWPDMQNFSHTPARITALSTGATISDAQSTFVGLPHTTIPEAISNLVSGQPTWPQSGQLLPLEIYEMIVYHLSRDDVKAMRLTCKTIEHSVSHFLFTNVVVPFNIDIYGIIQSDPKQSAGTNSSKGKQKMSWPSRGRSALWQNEPSAPPSASQAVDVFRSFGPHMKKFGITFELDENLLSALPPKEEHQTIQSYWGEYNWPHADYQRYEDIARMETTADAVPIMVQAFSYLRCVEELALSIDAGTGWLRGPDRSFYQRLFHQRPKIWESSFRCPDRRQQNQEDLWQLLRGLFPKNNGDELANAEINHKLLSLSPRAFDLIHNANVASGITRVQPSCLELQSLLDFHLRSGELQDIEDILCHRTNTLSRNVDDMEQHDRNAETCGLLVFTEASEYEIKTEPDRPLIPNDLTNAQKERLLETQWAQRAFISSYMLAIMDNPSTFQHVHTLNLSKITVHYLGLMHRDDFWDSLPQLRNVTILAISEWQQLDRDEAGYVQAKDIVPSKHCAPFEAILADNIAPRGNIKSLNVGWASGGEKAQGVFARNRHLMPSPLIPSQWRTGGLSNESMLKEPMVLFPFVEHLTLTNCWLLPTMLKLLVQTHCTQSLASLSLHSVSLTKNVPNLDRLLILNRYISSTHALSTEQTADSRAQNSMQQVSPMVIAIRLSRQLTTWTPYQIALVAERIRDLNAQDTAAALMVNNGTIPVPEQVENPPQTHREGCWRAVLDAISPGAVSADVLNNFTRSSVLPSRSSLVKLELESCGYCDVAASEVRFDDQEMVFVTRRDAAAARRTDRFFGQMLPKTRDSWFGTISHFLAPPGIQDLQTVWNVQIGWADERDRQEVFYDGYFAGGMGRFSCVIEAQPAAMQT